MRVLVVPLAACGGQEWVVETLEDEGTVCIEGDADATAAVHVDANIFLSSSCDRNAVGSCTATVDGTTITVTSSFSWETLTGKNVECTDDCGFLIAECDVGPLPAGTYDVVLGSDTSSVTVPTSEPCEF